MTGWLLALATCGYFVSTVDKVLEANCSRRVKLRSLPVVTKRAAFASFGRMRLPPVALSERMVGNPETSKSDHLPEPALTA